MRKIEYQFGRVMCRTGFGGVSEGLITSPEQIRAAYETLQLQRMRYGTEWISSDSQGLVSTEEKAEEVITYLKTAFNDGLKFSGEKPLDCAHGMIFFRKLAQLELTAEQETSSRERIGKLLGIEPVRVLDITFGWR